MKPFERMEPFESTEPFEGPGGIRAADDARESRRDSRARIRSRAPVGFVVRPGEARPGSTHESWKTRSRSSREAETRTTNRRNRRSFCGIETDAGRPGTHPPKTENQLRRPSSPARKRKTRKCISLLE